MRQLLMISSLIALVCVGSPVSVSLAGEDLSAQVLAKAEVVQDPQVQARIDPIAQRLGIDASKGIVITKTGQPSVLPDGRVLVPKAEISGCESDDEIAALVSVCSARAAKKQLARLKAMQSDLSGSLLDPMTKAALAQGDIGFILDPIWPEDFEREACDRACAELVKAKFDPSALVTKLEREALLAPDDPQRSVKARSINARRASLAAQGVTIRRSAVSKFFTIQQATSPDRGFAELVGKSVFREPKERFENVDWRALSGLLDNHALVSLQVQGDWIVDGQTRLIRVIGAGADDVLKELKSALTRAMFELSKL